MKCYLYGGECNKECDCYSCNYVRCYRDAIDDCIKDLEQCYPLVDNGDILYGFSCAIQRLKQLKKLDKLSSTAQE